MGLIREIQRDTGTAVQRTEASAAVIEGGTGKLELAGESFQGNVGAIEEVLERSQGGRSCPRA
jgi:methyl-accepting chemotaxis protein